MSKTRPLALVLLGPFLLTAVSTLAGAAEGEGPRLAHSVFFTLKDRTPEARAALVVSCQKHLDGHEGVASFAVGAIAEDVVEPVSVRDFDVALLIVFTSKAAGDTYQAHPRHKAFIAENRATWAQVRVFDAYLPASD